MVKMARFPKILGYAGAHWQNALQKNDKIYLFTIMIPTILSAVLFILSYIFNVPFILFMSALLFFVQFSIDKKYCDLSVYPADYLCFRRHITALVGGILIASGVLVL